MAISQDPRTAKVGDALPSFTRTTGLHNWNRYAAVNNEFVPIHMDDEAGREAGYPSAFGMGNLLWAYVHNMLRDWMGPTGAIRKAAVQFRAANLKGQTVAARGMVVGVRETDGGRLLDLDVWVEADGGERLAPGSATVFIGR